MYAGLDKQPAPKDLVDLVRSHPMTPAKKDSADDVADRAKPDLVALPGGSTEPAAGAVSSEDNGEKSAGKPNIFLSAWSSLEGAQQILIAASIYNDTGFRAHQKGDFARSASLFAKAVAADPSHKLAQYNHACALAQLGDPKAKDALAAAIAKDASVKTRARTDKDFAKVRSEAWFVDLVR
jgi:hypothetical protein